MIAINCTMYHDKLKEYVTAVEDPTCTFVSETPMEMFLRRPTTSARSPSSRRRSRQPQNSRLSTSKSTLNSNQPNEQEYP